MSRVENEWKQAFDESGSGETNHVDESKLGVAATADPALSVSFAVRCLRKMLSIEFVQIRLRDRVLVRQQVQRYMLGACFVCSFCPHRLSILSLCARVVPPAYHHLLGMPRCNVTCISRGAFTFMVAVLFLISGGPCGSQAHHHAGRYVCVLASHWTIDGRRVRNCRSNRTG